MKALMILWAVLLVLPCMVLATPVPDTGQIACYDSTQEITCSNPGEEFYGQDAQYITNPQSYTKLDENGNDLPDEATDWAMVRDNVTGLIWEVKTDDSSIHDKDNVYNWYDASNIFIEELNNIQFGGYSNWRLPTAQELALIISHNTFGPSINTAYFPNTISTLDSWYWSYNIDVADASKAWVVGFYYGAAQNHTKASLHFVRAVIGEPFSNNFVDNNNETITDKSTGLMWQKNTFTGINWNEALTYCENLDLGGYNDWRMPNFNELQTLTNYNDESPAISISFFPDTLSSNYWSSTTGDYPDHNFAAWAVYFRNGWTGSQDKLRLHSLRAVRGFGIDADHDGIFEDGDISGTFGDHPCIGGAVDNCDDNCPGLHNSDQTDVDSDGIGDVCDSCPLHPNSPILGFCVGAFGLRGITCVNNEECGSGGICCMNQSCASGCDCKSNFDCDYDVDGTDAARFKADFGRSLLSNPCDSQNICNGDFECDHDVDGTDAADFKKYFGVSPLGGYCLSCVDGVYQFSCPY